MSIYGMGRFPVTLYKEQWLKLLDMSSDIGALTLEQSKFGKRRTNAKFPKGWALDNCPHCGSTPIVFVPHVVL